MAAARFTGSWPTLAAWGAGLVQLALGAGVIMGDVGPGPRAVGVGLATIGAATLVAGVVWLARGVRRHRLALTLAVAGILAMAAALAVDPAHVSVAALAVGVALEIALAVSILGLRRAAQPRRTTQAAPRRVGVSGLLVGAVVVAAAVTPALASTEAGRLAPDHSRHTLEIGHQH
ncbi:hypothetical protein [Microbacterium telephonicum]|uniref:Uncharacterized protein n=1 Tax=Microbacterium telephonicum TaxID=1714841 RepID=A0A498CL07_9MICO|nr:hypothetical protein [Microbacterium telephonicum]RLK52721.1 hypothetical protein C7474_0674 [Microbacterium telephonicum]